MLRIAKSPSFSLLKRSLATHTAAAPPTRHDWTKEEVKRIYDAPLLDLVFRSASVHRQHQDPSKIQLCTLMNIKSEWYCARKKLSKSVLQVGAVAKTVRSAQ
jgi:biotin synthase